jgi:hypothetical protein
MEALFVSETVELVCALLFLACRCFIWLCYSHAFYSWCMKGAKHCTKCGTGCEGNGSDFLVRIYRTFRIQIEFRSFDLGPELIPRATWRSHLLPWIREQPGLPIVLKFCLRDPSFSRITRKSKMLFRYQKTCTHIPSVTTSQTFPLLPLQSPVYMNLFMTLYLTSTSEFSE